LRSKFPLDAIKLLVSGVGLQLQTMNFLDLKPKNPHLEILVDCIYKKPTTTDTIINFKSNHPLEPKTAAFKYHITRMHLLPLTAEKKKRMGDNTKRSYKEQFPTTTTKM
jgi:hypothetical protein